MHLPSQIASAVLLITSIPISSSRAFVGKVSHFSRQRRCSCEGPMREQRQKAVPRSDTYTVTLLPGDGIGPEITAATKEVLASLSRRCGFTLKLRDALIGGAAIDARGDPFPAETLELCRTADSVLLACIGGYKVRTSLGMKLVTVMWSSHSNICLHFLLSFLLS